MPSSFQFISGLDVSERFFISRFHPPQVLIVGLKVCAADSKAVLPLTRSKSFSRVSAAIETERMFLQVCLCQYFRSILNVDKCTLSVKGSYRQNSKLRRIFEARSALRFNFEEKK